jgi:hypothetical protein
MSAEHDSGDQLLGILIESFKFGGSFHRSMLALEDSAASRYTDA